MPYFNPFRSGRPTVRSRRPSGQVKTAGAILSDSTTAYSTAGTSSKIGLAARSGRTSTATADAATNSGDVDDHPSEPGQDGALVGVGPVGGLGAVGLGGIGGAGGAVGSAGTLLPDFDTDFVNPAGIAAFAAALANDNTAAGPDEALLLPDVALTAGAGTSGPEGSSARTASSSAAAAQPEFFSSLNDWSPIRERVRRRKPRSRSRAKKSRSRRDETREGVVYALLKWPLLVLVLGWMAVLAITYLATRIYIFMYENAVTWRGGRQKLRQRLRQASSYAEWVTIAQELDLWLGNDRWRERDEYGYYNSNTICRVADSLRQLRLEAEEEEPTAKAVGPDHQTRLFSSASPGSSDRPIDRLKTLLEGCVKANFGGVENARLYSETYYGTKKLVQRYTDELTAALAFVVRTRQLDRPTKRALFRHMHANFGRTALCLSGGATLSYYHFGVVRALLDADLLPTVISGTSGGALVAGLLATRTDNELRQLLVPELADKITACHDPFTTWFVRWWKTGARFDAVDWAKRASWFCRGDMTFREAFDRTGRIVNVSCVPADPHSPTMLVNHLTAPDCVIWSAVIASSAVPGILNPVVLMRKRSSDGTLEPLSFGHKWKDGSLRTDIPLRALNLDFGVRFPIVSQVNPHVSLFFFESRGTVGRPVTHRRGRGWRGGFLGSACEQYLKLDLTKWLKVLRHLELLPRPLGQDWSSIWLQRFSGVVTIWPKSVLIEDVWKILSDPDQERLSRMIQRGKEAAWPKLLFVRNRIAVERLIERGRKTTRTSKDDELVDSNGGSAGQIDRVGSFGHLYDDGGDSWEENRTEDSDPADETADGDVTLDSLDDDGLDRHCRPIEDDRRESVEKVDVGLSERDVSEDERVESDGGEDERVEEEDERLPNA